MTEWCMLLHCSLFLPSLYLSLHFPPLPPASLFLIAIYQQHITLFPMCCVCVLGNEGVCPNCPVVVPERGDLGTRYLRPLSLYTLTANTYPGL